MDVRKHISRMKQSSLDDNKLVPEVERALAYVGLFSRVANQIDRSPHHVLETAKGRRQSKAVIDAIVREVRGIDRRFQSGRERVA